jgi:hypothetical protein
MEDKHHVLYNYYAKYNAGNNALRISKNIGKVSPIIKTILTQVVEDLPGRMKESVRDQIATDIFQGKNPLETFSQSVLNRAYNEMREKGEYDRYELDKAFGKKSVIIDSNANTNMSSLLKKSLSNNYMMPKTDDYFKNAKKSYNENQENINEFRGGSIYKYKISKYQNKLKYICQHL